jgi:flavin-dependent dehydrogenase
MTDTLVPRYDAIVVGARCAGAATAMLLARAGARVLVLDRDAEGADTLSTHALMRGAVMQLARWGVLPRIVAAGTPPVRQTTFAYGPDRTVLDIGASHGVDALYAPRRTVVDPALVAAARAAGADVRFETAVQRLLFAPDGRVSGVEAVSGGRRLEFAAGIVIGADGRRSTVARRVEAATHVTTDHAGAALYAYVAGLADRGYRWHYAPGVGSGAIPTNDGLHCVFVSVPPQRYRQEIRRDPIAGFAAALAEADPGLAAEVAAGRIVSRPLGFAGEPGFLRQSHGPGWALVGDAGYFKDPITAHGITDALRDAELLARAVIEGGGAALASYQETRDALSLPLLRVTDAIAAYDWDLPGVQELHLELNRAMKAELEWMAGAWPALPKAA